MHYSFEVDVLTSHTSTDPLIFPMKLASGILRNVDFLFEVGDGYSSCLTLWDRGKQLLPTNADGFYSADGLLVSGSLWYDIDENDNDLFLVAWNRGGVYDHAVIVMLDVKDPNEPELNSVMSLMIDTINRLIDLCKKLI